MGNHVRRGGIRQRLELRSRLLVATASGVLLLGGGGAVALATAGSAPAAAAGSLSRVQLLASTGTEITPSVPVYTCDSGATRTLQQAYTTASVFEQQNCNGFEVTLNGAGVAGLSVSGNTLTVTKLDGTTVSTTLPSASPQTAAASFSVTNDPDTAAVAEPLTYPNGGIWADDNFTFTINAIRHSAVPVADCSNAPAGTASCYFYTGSAAINGTWKSLGGNTVSPLGGKTMTGVPQGTINGTFNFEFYADSGTLTSPSVAPIDNTGETYAAGSGSAAWYAPFFPAGTKITSSAGANEVAQPNYSFTYVATSETCTAPATQEVMVQAFSGNTGDITGACAG